LILPHSAADEVAVEDDYIELRPLLERKRGFESPSLAAEDVDYRSIEGKAKTEPGPADEDMEYTTESDDREDEDEVNRAARDKNATLNRTVKDDPRDVDAWLALIEHQADVVLPGHDESTFTSSQRRTLADIRLVIYDRALKTVSKDGPEYDKLVLGRMKEGSALWENSKIATKWTEALKDNPSSITLWTKYLDFVQTDHVNFRFENCKETYIECLHMLNNAHSHASPEKVTSVLSAQIYVLLRYTSFVRDAGYDELAHAIWQIVLEYQFFKPPNLSNNDEVLESLEAFWESDARRIGEEEAEGWKAFCLSASHGSRTSNTISKESEDAGIESFAQRESKAMQIFHLPATTDDEVDSDDPFRFVMFADLRDVIESLLNDLPKPGLINAFLCFMQLPALRSLDPLFPQESFRTDPFLCQSNYNSPPQRPTSFADLSHGARLKHGTEMPFSLFHDAFRRSSDSDGENNSAAILFVDQALQRLATVLGENDDLVEYYLAFTLNHFPEKAAKSAKRLLKLRPSSLRLYNAYALIEAEKDNVAKAENVWATALKMSSTWPEEQRKDAIFLIHSRTMALLTHCQDTRALRYLIDPSKNLDEVSIVEQTTISSTEHLKATRMLREGFESGSASKLLERATLYVDCWAWFSYLVNGCGLAEALAVYEKYLAKLSSSTNIVALELLHQARADLLRMHIENKRPYKPILVRDVLVESIHQFPNTSLFYEVQALVGFQTRVDDRLRDALEKDSERRPEMGVVSWYFAIAKEIERCSTDGSGATRNSVRALFSKALLGSDSEVRHSPYLWTLWFQFERLVTGVPEPSNVKQSTVPDLRMPRQVFYEGLRHLPWYKPWVLMGMRHLIKLSAGSEVEMQRLYDVMTEREIRVRQELGS
jgi:hypothetical protein